MILQVFQQVGTTEIIVIAVVLLILFGGKQLPKLGKGLGESVREFKKGAGGSEKKESKDED